MIGEMICRMEMPQARMAVISLSAESRPKTSIMDTSDAHGIEKASAIGSASRRNFPAVRGGTPWLIYSIIFMRLVPVMAKVRTMIDMAKVARKFFVMYQLRINIKAARNKKMMY